jgi:transaldolase
MSLMLRPFMESSLRRPLFEHQKNQFSELIWASPRELLNIYQANEIGCHIITVTQDILKKLNMVGYDLDKYSLDTVKMFYSDALIAGFKI